MTALLLAFVALFGCSEDLDILRSGPAVDGGTRDATIAAVEPMILYRFDEGAGDRALDSSRSGPLVHLTVEDPSAVRWIPEALVVESVTRLQSDAPPSDFVRACRRSGGMSIEAWIVPAETVVDGTRRIVSMSGGGATRNFTLGQGALFAEPAVDAYVLRLRTSTTGDNGLPMLSTGPSYAQQVLTHVIAIHRADGSESIYVDGRVVVEGTRLGDFASWDESFLLVVANEISDDTGTRAWLGELHQIALFPRALTPDEVAQRFGAGGPG